MLPRNLSASFPAMTVLVGALLTSLERRVAVAAAVVVVGAVLLVGAGKALEEDHRRTSLRGAAGFIDVHARPGDPVLAVAFLQGPVTIGLGAYFERPHPVVQGDANDPRAWGRGRDGAHVFLVMPTPGAFRTVTRLERLGGPGKRFELIRQRRFRGSTPLLVGEYMLRGRDLRRPSG